MKKTLVALAVTAFAASASAVTVYDQDGSTVDFYGSIRLLLDNGNTKVKGGEKKEKHTNLHNDGSRFGVKVKHNISDDFYALGRVEFRFDDKESGTTDQFGNLYAKRAFVGFGSKEFGELTFGRQVLIGDDIAQAGFDYKYGVFDDALATSSTSAIRYDYKGFENAILSADYRFAEKRGDDHNVDVGELKSGYDIGAVYNFKLAENQSATVAAGYSHDSYATETNKKDRKDAYQFGAKYTIDALTLAADYARTHEKGDNEKYRFNEFRLGMSYAITPEIDVYGTYGYQVAKAKVENENVKGSEHKYMVGSSYRLTKNVLTYVEAAYSKVKLVDNGSTGKGTRKDIGVGLRVSW